MRRSKYSNTGVQPSYTKVLILEYGVLTMLFTFYRIKKIKTFFSPNFSSSNYYFTGVKLRLATYHRYD